MRYFEYSNLVFVNFQLHQFKTAVPGIQALNTTVTLAQVVPSRTLVYSTGTPTAFPRGPTTVTTRPMGQVTAARLAVPVTVGATRILAPQGAVLTPAARITAIPASQATSAPTRIISTQSNISLGRITVSVTNSATSVNPILTQMRPNLVVPTSNVSNRGNAAQGAKVVAQPATIHLPPMQQAGLKTSTLSTPRTSE